MRRTIGIILKLRDGHQIGDEMGVEEAQTLIHNWKSGYDGFFHIQSQGWEWCVHTREIVAIHTAILPTPAQQGQQIPRRPLPGTSGLN